MKISAALLLSSAISSSVITSVAAGRCVTSATSDRDQCLCGCLRSGYDCDGTSIVDEADLEAACKSSKIAGGPCRWDPDLGRTDGSSCASCAATNFCGGGGGGPEEPPTTNCGDTPDCDPTYSRQECNKECCNYAKVQGVWTCGPKV